MVHREIIKLVIAWTLTGAFVFTVFVTCLSLVGVIELANAAQQQKLFSILIVQLIGGGVAYFFDFLDFRPDSVVKGVIKRYVNGREREWQGRTGKLLDQIDAFPDARAIAAENTFRPLMETVVDRLDPANQRATSGSAARQILKVRVAHSKGSEQDLDVLREALTTTKEPVADAVVQDDIDLQLAMRVRSGAVRSWVETEVGQRFLMTEWNVSGQND